MTPQGSTPKPKNDTRFIYKRASSKPCWSNPRMDGMHETSTAAVSFIDGKFGKRLPIVDSFIFYPKDGDRVRFRCKTRGCNATITIAEDTNRQPVVRGHTEHNHPNHAQTILNKVHIQRLGSEVNDVRNKYVPTKTVISSVRNQTKTCRRKAQTTD